MRPGVASWIADEKVAVAASRRCVSSGSTSRPTRRCATPSDVADSSAVATAGHPVDQLVRLVDDQQLVFGQHGGVGDGVDGQQRVVGDDDIGVPGLVAGLLGEAVGAERAAGHADAFPGRHADLRPRPVRHAGLRGRRGHRSRSSTPMR